MVASDKAVKLIHGLARIEVDYQTALDVGRGLKAHTRNLERQRVAVFEAIVGRPPTGEEKEALLWGDA